MKILALDPGTTATAYAVWNGSMLIDKGHVANSEIISRVLPAYSDADYMAIELLQCFGMPVGKEVFETAYWIGTFCQVWKSLVLAENIWPVFRKEIVKHFCHSIKGNDATVKTALKDRFGDKGTKAKPGVFYGTSGNDMWSAVSIAICVWDRIAEGEKVPKDRIWNTATPQKK